MLNSLYAYQVIKMYTFVSCNRVNKIGRTNSYMYRAYSDSPAHSLHLGNVVLMLGQRRRRWPKIKTTLAKCIVHILTPLWRIYSSNLWRETAAQISPIDTGAQLQLPCVFNLDSSFSTESVGLQIGPIWPPLRPRYVINTSMGP